MTDRRRNGTARPGAEADMQAKNLAFAVRQPKNFATSLYYPLEYSGSGSSLEEHDEIYNSHFDRLKACGITQEAASSYS